MSTLFSAIDHPKSHRDAQVAFAKAKVLEARGLVGPEPGQGVVAICGHGKIGLIILERPEHTSYPDGSSGEAWKGVLLWPNDHVEGIVRWSSRSPLCLGKFPSPRSLDELLCFSSAELFSQVIKDGKLAHLIGVYQDAFLRGT